MKVHDREYVLQVTALLQAVLAQVKDAVAPGKSLEETYQLVNVAEMRAQFVGEDDRLGRAFEMFFFRPAVESAYKELAN